MNFLTPDYVKKLLDILEEDKFQAFIVGGSVRDTLLGKEPSDYDITTDAIPDQIEKVFKDFRTIEVGKEFGTIVVVQKRAM